jgi:hypothetical protein
MSTVDFDAYPVQEEYIIFEGDNVTIYYNDQEIGDSGKIVFNGKIKTKHIKLKEFVGYLAGRPIREELKYVIPNMLYLFEKKSDTKELIEKLETISPKSSRSTKSSRSKGSPISPKPLPDRITVFFNRKTKDIKYNSVILKKTKGGKSKKNRSYKK